MVLMYVISVSQSCTKDVKVSKVNCV